MRPGGFVSVKPIRLFGDPVLRSPAEPVRSIRRCYRDGSLILETTFETESGSATLIDCMIP